MRNVYVALFVLGVVALLVTGCTTTSPPSLPAQTGTISATIPSSVPTSQIPAGYCTKDSDCIPDGNCHPTSCSNSANSGVSGNSYTVCTANCAGPLDCGAGSCGCVQNSCRIVPARPGHSSTSIMITASPNNYTPLMSSTPGIKLDVNTTGFDASKAAFVWNASYGEFLSWSPPDFVVHEKGNPVTNQGETMYWTFRNKTTSTTLPVVVSVVAKDPVTGTILGNQQVTLEWTGDFAVTVQKIQ